MQNNIGDLVIAILVELAKLLTNAPKNIFTPNGIIMWHIDFENAKSRTKSMAQYCLVGVVHVWSCWLTSSTSIHLIKMKFIVEDIMEKALFQDVKAVMK